jgi:tryptophan halogenase
MSTESRSVDDVLIVGGGDIGLLTGLCIERLNPAIEIVIVDDFSKDPPEVGKSTYQEIVDIFHDFLEIEEQRFLREVKPIWKGSVYFRDWTGYDPFHYTFDDLQKYPDVNDEHYLEKAYLYYDDLYGDPDYRTVNEWMVERQTSPISFGRGGGYSRYGSRAYHLDLSRFNSFLVELCRERGVDLVDDMIASVETDGDDIAAVRSEADRYEADLVIDASGFTRAVTDVFNDEFRSFDLPLDSAFNIKTERELADAVPATVIESGDYGWFWQIDTYEFRDMGYVFASEFVSDSDAAAEFVAHCDSDVSEDDLTHYEFDSGYFKRTWKGNRIRIGNAAGFVEPLQSTGLTANATAATRLSHLLAAHGAVDYAGARDDYNAWVKRMWESIYDFISIHYAYADGETEFWESVRSIPISDRVQRVRSHFDQCGYDTRVNPLKNPRIDRDPTVDFAVFPVESYYTMMRNMGIESKFYEQHTIDVGDEPRAELEQRFTENEESASDLLTIEQFYRGVLAHESSI